MIDTSWDCNLFTEDDKKVLHIIAAGEQNKAPLLSETWWHMFWLSEFNKRLTRIVKVLEIRVYSILKALLRPIFCSSPVTLNSSLDF